MLYIREYREIVKASQLRPGDVVKLDYPYVRGTKLFAPPKPHYAVVINSIRSMKAVPLHRLTHVSQRDLIDPSIRNNPLVLTKDKFRELDDGDTAEIFKSDYQGSKPSKIFTPLFLDRAANLSKLKMQKLGYLPKVKNREAYNQNFRQKFSTNNFSYIVLDQDGELHLFNRSGGKDVEYDKEGKPIEGAPIQENLFERIIDSEIFLGLVLLPIELD